MNLLYKRNLETATVLTSLDLAVGYRINSLYDTRLASYTLFTAGSDIVRIHIEFEDVLSVDSVGIGGHSFGEGSTLSVNGNPAQEFSTRTGLVLLDNPLTVSSFDLEIYDPSLSPGGERYIGRLELGDYYITPDISPGIKIDSVSSSDAVFSSSRQVYGYRRAPYARLSLQMPLVETPERRQLMGFFQYVDLFVPFFASLGEECLDIADNYVVLSDNNMLAFQLTEGRFYTCSMVLSEVN